MLMRFKCFFSQCFQMKFLVKYVHIKKIKLKIIVYNLFILLNNIKILCLEPKEKASNVFLCYHTNVTYSSSHIHFFLS